MENRLDCNKWALVMKLVVAVVMVFVGENYAVGRCLAVCVVFQLKWHVVNSFHTEDRIEYLVYAGD